MRTTLEIDDGVLAAARSLAHAEGTSIGAALSDLARRGLDSRRAVAVESGLPVFQAPAGAAPITLDLVNGHRDD